MSVNGLYRTPKELGGAGGAATVGVGPRSEVGFGLELALNINLRGLDRAAAETHIAQAQSLLRPQINPARFKRKRLKWSSRPSI